jgi:predicted RNase H-like HicB family nuclease
MGTISIEREDGWFIITDEDTGVTTQGESKAEALLMLTDALTGYDESDEDPLAMAVDVFVPDPDDRGFLAEFEGEAYEPPDVDEEQVRQQREAALWLAKSHKKTDYSEPHQFGMLRSLIYRSGHSIPIEYLGELLESGAWSVFKAIATGARTIDEIAVQLDRSDDQICDAVQTLEHRELIARAADGRLFAAQNVVGIGPYPIDNEHIIHWEAHYEHTLARNLDEDELPTSVEEGVFVERQGTGYGWYHDPAVYSSYWTDEVVLSREEAENEGSNPCPECFSTTEYSEQFDVIDLPGGVTKYERTGSNDNET